MEKLKCPHCGAMNQDVKMSDLCWQCDFALDAPKVEDVDLAKPHMHTAANAASDQVQLQQIPPHQVLPTPPSSASRKIPVAAIVAVLIILLLIAFYLFRPK